MIYSYVAKTVEQGGWTGVCRFDSMLRKVFPELQSVTGLPELKADDVVITDNHLSLEVPERIKAVVVHHGCAQTHYNRDRGWQTPHTKELTEKQQDMFGLLNRTWVAPSSWVASEFMAVRHGNMSGLSLIPHWVEPIPRLMRNQRPVIIGDWRDNNKGSGVWRKLAARCPQWDIKQLNFKDDEGRRQQYGTADLYLCLSLSEGFNYGMADAEAAELPIVTTDTGAYREFTDCEVIRWQDRDYPQIVADAIERKLRAGRQKPSFYREYTFDKWAELWRNIIQ